MEGPFYMGVHETVSSSGLLSTLSFFYPCGRYGRFYGFTDRSNVQCIIFFFFSFLGKISMQKVT